MHLLESRRQREWLDATYRQGIVRFLDDIGLLSPRLTVAHGVHLTDEECALLAERGVTVAVNTSCNLRLRSGVAPVARFLRHGLRFGFGLDGCAHDDDQDYFRDLRLAWRLHNGTGLEQAQPPGRLLDAACRHGFRCIDGSDDYGEVVPGARADLVVLDYAAMTEDFLTPEQDEIDILLTRATSRQVRDLLVAGRWVVGNGVLIGLDLADAEREFLDRARRVAGLNAAQAARHRRRREGVRGYYAGGYHLDGRSGPPKRRGDRSRDRQALSRHVQYHLSTVRSRTAGSCSDSQAVSCMYGIPALNPIGKAIRMSLLHGIGLPAAPRPSRPKSTTGATAFGTSAELCPHGNPGPPAEANAAGRRRSEHSTIARLHAVKVGVD